MRPARCSSPDGCSRTALRFCSESLSSFHHDQVAFRAVTAAWSSEALRRFGFFPPSDAGILEASTSMRISGVFPPPCSHLGVQRLYGVGILFNRHAAVLRMVLHRVGHDARVFIIGRSQCIAAPPLVNCAARLSCPKDSTSNFPPVMFRSPSAQGWSHSRSIRPGPSPVVLRSFLG